MHWRKSQRERGKKIGYFHSQLLSAMQQMGHCILLLDRHGLQTALLMGESDNEKSIHDISLAYLLNPKLKRKLKDDGIYTIIISRYRKKKNGYIVMEPPVNTPPDAWKLKAKEMRLSNREINVLEKFKAGLSAKEAGAELFITEDTVEVHKRNIFSKLEVNKITAVIHLLEG